MRDGPCGVQEGGRYLDVKNAEWRDLRVVDLPRGGRQITVEVRSRGSLNRRYAIVMRIRIEKERYNAAVIVRRRERRGERE